MQRVLALGAAMLAGCTTPAKIDSWRAPALITTVLGAPAPIDGRGEFRRLFCARVEQCDRYLWRLEDEHDAPVPRTPPAHELDRRMHIVMVGAAFGDCYPEASRPFGPHIDALRQRGFTIDEIHVAGRSSSTANAVTIRDAFRKIKTEPHRPVVMVGYSKGVNDALLALASYPEVSARVAALVGVAGAINGSPLAEHYGEVVNAIAVRIPLGQCAPGDRGVIASLRPSERIAAVAKMRLPPSLKLYSIASFTPPENAVVIFEEPHQVLSRFDPRNDGQLLMRDQIIPGSKVLGYLNADHWAVAIRMEEAFPHLAHRTGDNHPFPQSELFDALLLSVQHDVLPASR